MEAIKAPVVVFAIAAIFISLLLARQKSPPGDNTAYRNIIIAVLAALLLFALYKHFTRKLDATKEESRQVPAPLSALVGETPQEMAAIDSTGDAVTGALPGDKTEGYINYDALQGHYGDIQAMTSKTMDVIRPSVKPSAISTSGANQAASLATLAANNMEGSEFAPVARVSAGSTAGGAHAGNVIHGNFLDVTTKDVNSHAAISNNALIPVMEQYMKIHENDPTRGVTLQSSMGLPFYDTRDPVNVKISEFPSTISAKLPIV